MAKFSFEVEGLDKLSQQIAGLHEKIRREVMAESYQFGEEIMAASKEIVPVDTGNLMNTGHVEQPPHLPSGGNPSWSTGLLPASDNEVLTVLAYGGPAVKYALYVHENLNPDVHWSRPGSGPKYLESPFKERQDQFPKRVSDAVARALKV